MVVLWADDPRPAAHHGERWAALQCYGLDLPWTACGFWTCSLLHSVTARFLWCTPQNNHKERILKIVRILVPISRSPGLLSLSGSFTAAHWSNSPPFSAQSCEEAHGHSFSNTSACLPKVGQCSMSSARLFLGRRAPCSGMAQAERASHVPDVTPHPAAKLQT